MVSPRLRYGRSLTIRIANWRRVFPRHKIIAILSNEERKYRVHPANANDHRTANTGRTVYQYHSIPVCRRRAEREFRTPGPAHGRGGYGLYIVDQVPQI